MNFCNVSVEEKMRNCLYRLHLALCEGKYVNGEGHVYPETTDGTPIRKLFVGNLAKRTSHKDLQELFSSYGKVEGCYLKRNQNHNNYAFVTFSNVADAIKALEDSIKTMIRLHNRDLRVVPAHSWHQPENQFFTKHIAQDYIQDTDSDCKINMLNDDCLAHIFLYLPIADRVRIERVCKRWRIVSRQSWRSVTVLDCSRNRWNLCRGIPELEVDTTILRKVLLRCGTFLTKINLTPLLTTLDRSTLLIIAKLCPNLRVLEATTLDVSRSAIAALAEDCCNIKKLTLGRLAPLVTDKDLALLFKTNPNIQYLKLIGQYLNGDFLRYLSPETLEKLFLHNCCISTKLFTMIARFENLTTLSIRGNAYLNLTDNPIALLKHCKKLRNLELSNFGTLFEVSNQVANCELENLEYLILRNNQLDHDLNFKPTFKRLKYLDISDCVVVKHSDVSAFARLPQLEVFILNDTNWPKLRLAEEEMLPQFSKLKHWECRRSVYLTDEDVAYLIAHLPGLEVLDVVQCIQLTPEVLKTAATITTSRKENVLKMFVDMPQITNFDHTSPFLCLINVDSENNDTKDYSSNGTNAIVIEEL